MCKKDIEGKCDTEILLAEILREKPKVCRKCKRTKKRPEVGVGYWYKGTEKYEGFCEGCVLDNPREWEKHFRAALARAVEINKKEEEEKQKAANGEATAQREEGE